MSSKRDDLADFEDSKPPAKKTKTSKKSKRDDILPSDMTLLCGCILVSYGIFTS